MSGSEDPKEVIRRWNEEGWSGGKYDLAHEIISPNMQVHGAGGQAVGMGPDGLIDLIRTWRTSFPDGRMEIDDLIVEGDTVAIRNTWYGTQGAEFYGIPFHVAGPLSSFDPATWSASSMVATPMARAASA